MDLQTGGLNFIGNIGFGVQGLAFAPDGRLFGVDTLDDRLVEIDPTTGQGVIATTLNYDLFTVQDLTFDADGELWATGRNHSLEEGLLDIDPATGQAVFLGGLTFQGSATCCMPLSTLGNTVLTVHQSSLSTVDTNSLEIRHLDPPLSGAHFQDFMDFDSDGSLWTYFTDTGVIDPPFGSGMRGYDLSSASETAYYPTQPGLRVCGLAISSPQPPRDVPTLSGMALFLLAGLVSIAALRKLSRA